MTTEDDAPPAVAARSSHVPTGADYTSDRKFSDFPLSDEVLKGVTELGYIHATPVQVATMEAGIAGRDLIVRAKTGTGKTAAFCVPMVERVQEGARRTQAVVLAPTRELAQQIAAECSGIAAYRDVSIAVLVGGLPMGPQERALAVGAEIVVGTPGRTLDHMRRGTLDLSTAYVTVLDEADEMLSMGFFEDVTAIIDATSPGRQIMLFSATIDDETQRLVRRYLDENVVDIRLSTDADNVELIEHVIYETSTEFHKVRSLLFLLDAEDPTSAIIFCNTREDTATVASFLDRQGLDVQLLSGELSQARRSQVMQKVKAGEVRFLVATDVAARGIDISDLSHVINYSLPQDPSVYLHRTGRTGRIGKRGTAISLVGGTDLSTRRVLETQHALSFTVKELPSGEDAVRKRVERQAAQIRAAMGTMVFEAYLPTVRALRERPDGDALLAAALRAFFQWDRQRRAVAGGIDTIGEVRERRNEKADRKRARRGEEEGRGSRRGGTRDRPDRGEGRPERGARGDRARPRRETAVDLDELDSLLETQTTAGGGAGAEGATDEVEAPDTTTAAGGGESSEGGEPKKRRKRRRRKGRGDRAAAGGTGAGPDSSPSEAVDLDDLDTLLSAD